jgi:hypothetical protein
MSTGGAAPTAVWTHLAGVYDATASTLQLFVNGRPQPAVTLSKDDQPQATSGPLTVGCSVFAKTGSGTCGSYFSGLVDEVKVWRSAWTKDDLAPVVAGRDGDPDGDPALTMVGGWLADEGTKFSVPDSSNYSRGSLTLADGAKLADGEDEAADVVVLDGTSAYGSATGPLVDDSGSFTVSVEVEVDKEKLKSKPAGYRAQIVGQRSGAAGKESSWSLWYEQETSGDAPSGRWKFGRVDEKTTGAVEASVDVASEDGATLGERVVLTGVYDTATGLVQLFVADEAPAATTKTFSPLRTVSGGPVTVGRGIRGGTWGDYLPGRLATVRVWSGAMTRQQVREYVMNEDEEAEGDSPDEDVDQ